MTPQPATDGRAARRSSSPSRSALVAEGRPGTWHHPEARQFGLVDALANAAIAVAWCAGMSVLGSVWAMRNLDEDRTR